MAEPLCFECGRPATCHHHVVPVSRGGTKTVPLCEECHNMCHHKRGHMSISTLTAAAMAHKRSKGERVDAVPYGYTLAADGVHLLPERTEQAVIAAVKELRGTGLSLRAVSDCLASRGYRSRNGRPFGPTQINRIAKAKNVKMA